MYNGFNVKFYFILICFSILNCTKDMTFLAAFSCLSDHYTCVCSAYHYKSSIFFICYNVYNKNHPVKIEVHATGYIFSIFQLNFSLEFSCRFLHLNVSCQNIIKKLQKKRQKLVQLSVQFVVA